MPIRKSTLLKVHRAASGFSQARLAEVAGTYQVRLSRIERGCSSPTLEEAARIAEALGVAPSLVFPGEDSER